MQFSNIVNLPYLQKSIKMPQKSLSVFKQTKTLVLEQKI